MDRNQHVEIDEAFQLLRSSSANLSTSFSQVLEDRLMKEQVRMSRPVGRRVVMALLIAFGGLVAGGGAVGYAAANGWLTWVFSVDEEGTVKNESGEVVGATYDNEDGSTTTLIGDPEGVEYRIHTEEPLNGRRITVRPAGNE